MELFGEIRPPEVVENSYGVLGAQGNPGLTGFLSNAIILVTIIGGLWALFNVVTGGLTLITAEGDSKELSKLGEKLNMTVIGLILMVGAPLIASLIGFFVFGDASILLKPSIPSAQSLLGP
jgi:uncharacterized membrane protein